MPETILRPTIVAVDTAALTKNVQRIQHRVGSRPIMAVVKANAYGHGLIETARTFLAAGVSSLAVAFLEEGVALRRAGIEAPVLVLGGIIGNQIHHFIEHDLAMAASSVFKLEQIDAVASRMRRVARVHLAIDTGMGRIGVQWDTAGSLVEAALKARHITIAGIYSHLAESEASDPEFTLRQIERFESVVDHFARAGEPAPTRHLANTGAILQHEPAWLDMVRPGLGLYGYAPSRDLEGVVALEPALALLSRVVFFKVVRQGRSVSYNRRWTASVDTRVVTIPIGYGDGYPRALSGRAQVVLRGKRRPIIGAVTMDAIMADLGPEGTAYNGDPVLLFGRWADAHLPVEEIAEQLGTVTYEVLTGINTRVPRVHVDPAKVSDLESLYRVSSEGPGRLDL